MFTVGLLFLQVLLGIRVGLRLIRSFFMSDIKFTWDWSRVFDDQFISGSFRPHLGPF